MIPNSQLTPRPIGVHVSIAGGFTKALERAGNLGCTAMQILGGNPRGWKPLKVLARDIEEFRKIKQKSSVTTVAMHAIYLINPAAMVTTIHEKSIGKLKIEVSLAAGLGGDFYVVHMFRPGPPAEARLERFAAALDEACSIPAGPKILIESTAGEGPGQAFQSIARLICRVQKPKRIGVCLDTAHLFGAGFNLRSRTGIEQTLDEIEGALGPDRVGLIHVNDSKAGLGSHQDRHEHIGEGKIGSRAMRDFLSHPRIAHIPLVLETPHMTQDEDRRNLGVLRRLLSTKIHRPDR